MEIRENRTRDICKVSASYIAGAFCKVFGRRDVIRFARFLSNYARYDLSNDMKINGECLLQDYIVAKCKTRPGERTLVAFDSGANVGDWSAYLLKSADLRSLVTELHAFEPCDATFSNLQRRLSLQNSHLIFLNNFALSSKSGNSLFYSVGENAGTNSLHLDPSVMCADYETATVSTESVDNYCRIRDISRIDILKIDCEGHDFDVLLGAREMISSGKIEYIQFEYNHRWINSRHFLKDVFELSKPLSYILGKLTPMGVELYNRWDIELETFREGNYLLATENSILGLPTVSWWK